MSFPISPGPISVPVLTLRSLPSPIKLQESSITDSQTLETRISVTSVTYPFVLLPNSV